MLPDLAHGIITILLLGTIIRIAEYLMASKGSENPLYKFLVFAY